MFELDADLPAELVPLSWLIGVWEGSGVIAYKLGDERARARVRPARRASPTTALPHLQYSSHTWLRRRVGRRRRAHARCTEIGYWRLSRAARRRRSRARRCCPAPASPVFTTAEAVETLRNERGAFDLEVLDRAARRGRASSTSARSRARASTWRRMPWCAAPTAKEYAAATRLYGLVDDHLLWAWDIAALGQDLRTHSSGRLARVD